MPRRLGERESFASVPLVALVGWLALAVASCTGISGPLKVGGDTDSQPPQTAIDSGPAEGSVTDATGATFTFSSDEPATYECDLDGGGFAACAIPKAYTGLADGPHTFMARGTDAAGNTDATPATRNWTVDTSLPDTAIDGGPPDPDIVQSPVFTFSSADGSAVFQCEMDGLGFDPCTSPKTYPALADGPHTFKARAVDTAGNIDPTPATHDWTVDSTAPETTIDSGPPEGSTQANSGPTFTFSADEPSTFECDLEGGGFTACASPKAYAGLAVGPHAFMVRATDTAGNLDATPATRNWTVNGVQETVDAIGDTGKQPSITIAGDGT
ncbi:hypothetical protein IIA16_05385, partial [bacterium]|nr:hypothetical protein [bacterium]